MTAKWNNKDFKENIIIIIIIIIIAQLVTKHSLCLLQNGECK